MSLSIKSMMTVFALAALLLACEKEEQSETTDTTIPNDTTGSTTTNLGSSHNTGKNCLSCHKFSVGGSVYKKDLASTYPGSVVKLSTQPNGTGTVVASLTTDNGGNIHTSSTISFGTGLYVSATGITGTKYMSAAITSGACNSCHGSSVPKAWTE